MLSTHFLVIYPQPVYPITKNHMIRSLCDLFDCFTDDYKHEDYVRSLPDIDIRSQLEVSCAQPVIKQSTDYTERMPLAGYIFIFVYLVDRRTIERDGQSQL